jgi:flagellar hook-associated protein 1 FlgK
MADLLRVAVSGLLSARRALDTVGHNIANVNTEGYSRQRVDLASRPPQFTGGFFAGNGVAVGNTRRIVDQFLVGQVRSSTSTVGMLDAYRELAGSVDNLLADPDGGLAPVIQSFFDAVHGVANDPASTPARQVMLTEADGLAQRFGALGQRLHDLDAAINRRLGDLVAEINTMAASLADVNRDVVTALRQGGGSPPNDLLDRREELLRRLAEKVNVTATEQDDGSLHVAIGSGQVLVAGAHSTELTLSADPYDATRQEVGIRVGTAVAPVSRVITGGEVAGLLRFREDVLDPAHNALGRIAVGLATTFNAQHRLGVDLNGAAGGDFFAPIDQSAPQVLRHARNSGAPPADLQVQVTDAAALTTSDYLLQRDAAGYSLRRLADDTITRLDGLAAAPATVDGLTLTLGGGQMAAGDSLLIRPTRLAARGFGPLVGDTAAVAAAAPLEARAAPGNLGSGRIGGLEVSSTSGLPLAGSGGPITLTFDPDALGAGVPGLRVSGGPGGALAYDPAAEAGGKTFTFAGSGGLRFTLSGAPRAGDTFSIADNTGAVGDNRNALLLGALPTRSLLGGGTASYQEAYGQMVVQLGTVTRQSEISLGAQQGLLDQSTAAREQLSGVNLDEEAADMLRYQLAYQASAQVIATARVLFDTLIDAAGG